MHVNNIWDDKNMYYFKLLHSIVGWYSEIMQQQGEKHRSEKSNASI